MRRYLRHRVPGACYFFTVNLAERKNNSRLVTHIEALRDAFAKTKQDHPFEINAIVVLPEHLHCLWTLPPDDADFSTRWSLIKARFSRALPAGEKISKSREAKGERGIWQRRFYEHYIRDDDDYAKHVDYIHWNPVKHGLVARAIDWPHSSIHRYIREGLLSEDWAADSAIADESWE
jgi:putative transposase